ncbi:MAG TPA: hypothetical protein VIY28_09945, partial [Pseudonocardiaceae bacterium]
MTSVRNSVPHAFITDRDGDTVELEADHRRHAAHRRRHQQPSGQPPGLVAHRPRRPMTVYVCPSCDAR